MIRRKTVVIADYDHGDADIERAIGALNRCQVIARYGTGIVDVDAATRRGILVTNVPSD